MESNTQSSFLSDFSTSSVSSSHQPVLKAKRIPLLFCEEEPRAYSLSQEAQNFLSTLKGQCYVISVSGNPSIGKSSLLNILISIFMKEDSQEAFPYQDIYPIGDKTKSTTQDIDLCCLSANGKNLIFLDIEGDCDSKRKDTGSWTYATLLQTAIGVSHFHFYNYKGLPQEPLLSNFELINRNVKENRIHHLFKTKYIFLLRDHQPDPDYEDMPDKELEKYKSSIDKRVSQTGIDYSLCLLLAPPQHILYKNSKKSCISLTGNICRECQSHSFLSTLLVTTNELKQHFEVGTSFLDGNDLRKALEHLIELNRRELPFYSDSGHLSQGRLDKLAREKERIQKSLLKVGHHRAQNSFYKEVQEFMRKHPNLADQQFVSTLEKARSELEQNISRIGYMIQELSTFVYQYLLNDGSLIFDEREKKALSEIYIVHFEDLTEKFIASSKEYNQMMESICNKFLAIREQDLEQLTNYLVSITSEGGRLKLARDMAKVGLKYVVREAVETVTSGVLGLGGDLFGGIMTVYCLISVCSEAGSVIERAAVERRRRTEDRRHTEEEMREVEEIIKNLIEESEKNRKALDEVCSEAKRQNLGLIEKISKAIEIKISGKRLSIEDRLQLLQTMSDVEKNLQRLKASL